MRTPATNPAGRAPRGLPERCRKSPPARRGAKSARAFTLASALLIGTTGCGPGAAEASRELAKKLTLAVPRPTPAAPAPAEMPRRVYLDASLSMRGFTSVEGDTTFGVLVEGLGDVLPGCQLFKYGQRGRRPLPDGAAITEVAHFGRELRQPQFYDLDYNPDDRLLAQLAEEEQPAFSVLITDAVYSVPDGATSPRIVEAVSKWLDRGYAFGIFVFKSPFEGTIYAENRPVSVPNVAVRERPFYAFVLSPGVSELTGLGQKLQQRIPQTRAIIFADSAVEMKADFLEQTKGTYSFKRPPGEPYYWHMLDADIFDGERAAVDYVVSYRVAPDYPVAEFRFDLTATYYRWDGKRFVEAKEGPPGGFQHKLDASKAQVASDADAAVPPGADRKRRPKPTPNLRIVYGKDSAGNYGFYHLKLLASPNSLRPEIQELSTRDDSDPRNAGSTFRFYELVNALTEIHFNKRLAAKASPQLFATITNR